MKHWSDLQKKAMYDALMRWIKVVTVPWPVYTRPSPAWTPVLTRVHLMMKTILRLGSPPTESRFMSFCSTCIKSPHPVFTATAGRIFESSHMKNLCIWGAPISIDFGYRKMERKMDLGLESDTCSAFTWSILLNNWVSAQLFISLLPRNRTLALNQQSLLPAGLRHNQVSQIHVFATHRNKTHPTMATLHGYESRRARICHQHCCTTVAARLVAETSWEQRKARAPMVKWLLGICDVVVVEWSGLTRLATAIVSWLPFYPEMEGLTELWADPEGSHHGKTGDNDIPVQCCPLPGLFRSTMVP